MDDKRVYLFDSTLRDGAQTQGVDFNVLDKQAIAQALDKIGVDYVEGGWPGANPTDDAFFAAPPALKHARLVAFGMTRRPGRSAANDPGLAALTGTKARSVCMVGKSWDFHVDVALGISRSENIDMIAESVAHAKTRVDEVMFDAEHFFDGYKANAAYALDCIKAAHASGARWIVLCDTNGGTLPHEIERIVGEATKAIPGSHLGIHCHNDTENAVANSLAAVHAGARQIQGTLNGLGERCGNANLVSLIPSLLLKTDFKLGIDREALKGLTHLSRLLDERLNRAPLRNAAYVGESAFAHKGGLHVSAVEKDPRTYEHIEPSLVGNRRHIVVSDQSGRANILARFRDIGLSIEADDPKVAALVELVKVREYDGYAYDGAEASFELLARRELGGIPDYFRVSRFRVMDDRRWNARGELVTESEATITLEVGEERLMTVATGNGPVNALDTALRKALLAFYPELEDMRLVDYKVRILTPSAGTGAVTRVMIESADDSGERWSTVGVSANIIDASFNALHDGISWKLFRAGAPVRSGAIKGGAGKD
ncbi:MAG TPA: citramalate synthase [Hypericibacter adhaerens]|jgi:2-isopropylmalate synthase|uniref:Citramalate synthase n=1 Tax=Hypericibacter adhaerens TaxID=2602016 RepID=A0A5J6N8P7_9PROT|nr:citramalate synthase [Hypericibacter adhaerens]QEX23686.1 citramalate synthase [Hypericibacter adhaerens]HWA45624.1 citramalate synthase [Hypericibacter adhaerens]